jgi:hypothetical protein
LQREVSSLNMTLMSPLAGISRRNFLSQSGMGLSFAAVSSLLAGDCAFGDEEAPPQSGRVKRVIWLFMHGGPSHVDLFDPKPDLVSLSGKPIPESFGMFGTRRDVAKNPLLGPVKPFAPRGKCGMMISDLLPETAKFADDLCLIRSMHGDSVNHPQSVYQMNTGNILMGKPSVGSWVSYGLGSENQDLPAFVVMPDPGGGLKGGPPAWGSGFLPAQYQGITMRPGAKPILHLAPPEEFSAERQRNALALINAINGEHLAQRDNDDQLAARIRSYELAFRMQAAAPDLVDLKQETGETLALYGIDEESTRDFGQRCLLARRMVERGVRFVQLYSGDTNGWDAHSDVLANHRQYCRATDKPVAGLLADLKRRGLWNDTLVIWGGEFGRMPMSEGGKGRDHNPWGYSMWLAGGAVKNGFTYGETDPIGLRALHNKVHIRDFHATLLHLLGLSPKEFSYEHNGLSERLIGPSDEARIVKEILA